MQAADITSGPVFRSLTPHRIVPDAPISGRDASNLIERLAYRARLFGAYSGHSLRAGSITAAAAAKLSVHDIMRVTRHRSLVVLQGYLRRV